MHLISIPKEIIDSCIKRRGKLHVFEKINAKKTALIVIDMQNSWVKPNMSVLVYFFLVDGAFRGGF